MIDLTDEKIVVDFQNRHIEENVSDFSLDNITPSEVSDNLNRCVARMAYYNSLLVDAKYMKDAIDAGYEAWYSSAYAAVDAEDSKKTEAWKKAQLILKYAADFKTWSERQRNVERVIGKVKVIANTLETQVRVLQTISATQRAELNALIGRSGSTPNLLDD